MCVIQVYKAISVQPPVQNCGSEQCAVNIGFQCHGLPKLVRVIAGICILRLLLSSDPSFLHTLLVESVCV